MNRETGLISTYARQSDELERIVAEYPLDALIWQPSNHRWSVLEIVGHLADAEMLASVRIRRMITQDRPNLFGYLQEEWAQKLFYRRNTIKLVAARFILLRRENASLLECITDKVWNHTGKHDEYGELTLLQLIEDYIEHTAKHLIQMTAIAVEFVDRSLKTTK